MKNYKKYNYNNSAPIISLNRNYCNSNFVLGISLKYINSLFKIFVNLNFDNLSILEGLLKVLLNSNIIFVSVILNIIALFYRYILPYFLNLILNITDNFI